MPSSAPLVLVADDEPSMLELVAHHLRTMNDPKLEVIQASDGEEAWRLAREHLPDLVVLDVMMPGMSGWEVCRKVREDVALAHTGVVMLTGIGENLNQLTSPLYGADTYIDKPFEFDDFDDRIRDTLKAREKQRLSVVRPPTNGTSAAAKPAPTKARKSGAKTAKNMAKAAVKQTAKKTAQAAPKRPSAMKTVKPAATMKTVKVAPKRPAAEKAVKPPPRKPAAKKAAAKKVVKAAPKKPAKNKAAPPRKSAKKKR